MTEEKTQKTPFYKKWWFWAIIVLVLIIAGAGSGGNTDKEEENTLVDDGAAYVARFDKLCEAVKEAYPEDKNVALTNGRYLTSCQDADTWQKNHDLAPDHFTYEYRNVNIQSDRGDISTSAELTLLRNSDDMERAMSEEPCSDLTSERLSCAEAKLSDDMYVQVQVVNLDKNSTINKGAAQNMLDDILEKVQM